MSSKSEGDLERLRRLHLFRIFKEVVCYDRCMFCFLGEGITELTGEDIKIMLKRSMRKIKKMGFKKRKSVYFIIFHNIVLYIISTSL